MRPAITPSLLGVTTPLAIPAWEQALETHPDRAFAKYIINGLRQGFRIGFNRACPLHSAAANMTSARLHPAVISDYIAKECSLGRMLGPFPLSFSPPELQVNRFGVIPKGHQTGKWRLITDLSFPPGRSVNDGIEPELCSLTYTTVDQVADIITSLGEGTLMAKVDIESAYRLIPVHPDDRPLQAVKWGDQLYVDPMLPFGLRSAPKIFNAVADALQWRLSQVGVQNLLHYLDDYIMVGPPGSDLCLDSLQRLLAECKRLGVPIAAHKTEGPAPCLTFLGIEIDASTGELRLPDPKLHRLQAVLREWGDKKVCQRKELESLVGSLNHAAKVVRVGRSFLRRMIDLLHSGPYVSRASGSAPIRLNACFRADLAWWQEFITDWNGVSFLSTPSFLPSCIMASDASGHWGCGAWFTSNWFQVPWDKSSLALPITMKELLPILVAGVLWGQGWRGRRVLCQCDNQAIVACLRSRSSRHSGIMHLLRNLAFVEARGGFVCHAVYINTHDNHLADDLSRNHTLSFLSKVPHASRTPSQVPPGLVSLLLDTRADWTSRQWRHRFKNILAWA